MEWIATGVNLGFCDALPEVACIENRDYSRKGSTALTTRHNCIRKNWQSLRLQAAVARSV
jgi:hypothetical protein